MPLRSWLWTAAVALVCFSALEILLRTGAVWRAPLPYLLQNGGDRHTRAVWLLHRPPPATTRQLVTLGASTAAAITELPDNEAERTLRFALRAPQLHLTSLAVSRACYDEHLTLMQNAIDLGHRPAVVVIFSWPGCLTDEYATDAVFATQMPLTSSWLASVDTRRDGGGVQLWSVVLRHAALARYRHALNGWVRSRWEGVLRGRMPWHPVIFAGDRRTEPWDGPWENDVQRYERLRMFASRVRTEGRGAKILERLLREIRDHGARAIVIEAPWSPPFFDVLHGIAPAYGAAMHGIAARTGAVYVNPNGERRLMRAHFNDLFHVNHHGARAYLPLVANAVAPLNASW